MARQKTEDNGKRERVPFGGNRKRLSVSNKEKGWEYHWFNDVEDRIERALEAGYEFVKKDSTQVGDPDLHNQNSDLNSRISKRVGANLTVYLMRIKEEFYDADQAEKQLLADQVDEAIYGGGADKVQQSYGLEVKYDPLGNRR